MRLKNSKHEAFCREYIKCGNATDAYMRAGYKTKSANVAKSAASRLLTDVNVRARIKELDDAKENTAANAVYVAALEIAKAFHKRQKQSREARQVGAALRETIARESHDHRETPQERREEKCSPTPPIKEESKETSITPKPPRVVFVPPTVEEVRSYCDERKNTIDPQSFIDFYSAKGWMIGSNRMKDWRAAVRNWETRRRNNGWVGRGVGVAGQADSRRTGTATAGNFRGGTDDQRAEAEAVL